MKHILKALDQTLSARAREIDSLNNVIESLQQQVQLQRHNYDEVRTQLLACSASRQRIWVKVKDAFDCWQDVKLANKDADKYQRLNHLEYVASRSPEGQ